MGVGRDDGEQAGEYAGIFYKRERIELRSNYEGVFDGLNFHTAAEIAEPGDARPIRRDLRRSFF